MNNIEVIGSCKKKRDMVKDMAMFCSSILMPKMSTLDIKIHLISKLISKEGIAGDCIWEDNTHLPREFTIRIDSTQKLKEMLESIAHEMVHVKQYAKGELKDFSYDTSGCKWLGKYIKFDKVNYYDHPWEIEAYGRERGLIVRWAYKCKWSKEVLKLF